MLYTDRQRARDGGPSVTNVSKGKYMATYAFGGTKGGPGKTTVATNAAVMRAYDRASDPVSTSVLLADSDKNQQSIKFAVRRLEGGHSPVIQPESMLTTAIYHQLMDRANKYGDIIVDCGGHDSPELRGVLQAADELIIPMRPNQLDLDVLPELHRLLEINTSFNPNLRCRVLMCQVRPGTLDAKREFMQKTLLKYPLCGPLMESHTTFRSTYETCQSTGLAVVEFARRNEVALTEMQQLNRELWQ